MTTWAYLERVSEIVWGVTLLIVIVLEFLWLVLAPWEILPLWLNIAMGIPWALLLGWWLWHRVLC
jgi:hypothetical protein